MELLSLRDDIFDVQGAAVFRDNNPYTPPHFSPLVSIPLMENHR